MFSFKLFQFHACHHYILRFVLCNVCRDKTSFFCWKLYIVINFSERWADQLRINNLIFSVSNALCHNAGIWFNRHLKNYLFEESTAKTVTTYTNEKLRVFTTPQQNSTKNLSQRKILQHQKSTLRKGSIALFWNTKLAIRTRTRPRTDVCVRVRTSTAPSLSLYELASRSHHQESAKAPSRHQRVDRYKENTQVYPCSFIGMDRM